MSLIIILYILFKLLVFISPRMCVGLACFRSGASTGGASEKGCRREGEQASGDPEVHSQEHKREEAAAGGAGGASVGAESSGGCESLLTLIASLIGQYSWQH